ncbi:hypothetical protein DFH29DRAFT_802250 [Suillus ampliporus]|nr:hypothetical protein DFH29DRAFT_802250 [Suillus ampliporus]
MSSTEPSRRPPLAGKPPFATDDPDELFDQPPPSKRRVRKPAEPNPNDRTSAYNMYPPMATEPKHGGIMNAVPIPLAAPRPGYPAPVSALNIPSPAATPEMRQVTQPLPTPTPRPSVPSAPHPLQPPMTPITPVFARPAKSPAPRDIQFTGDTIIRGGSEDNLMPNRGEKGDDFWRRFSIVARDEKKTSSWLVKTQSGSSKLSRWVWFVGVMLLICIAAGIGIGWYISHKSPSNTAPKAIGGSANETMSPTSTHASVGASSSTSLHVSPTNTVARRDEAEPTPAIRGAIEEFLEGVGQAQVVKSNVPAGMSRRHRRRISEIQF